MTRRFLFLVTALGILAFGTDSFAGKAKGGKGGGGGGGAGPLKVVRRLKGHENAITALAFAKDGTTLVSGSLDSTIKFWDTTKDKGNPTKSISLGEGVIIHQIVFHPVRPQLAVATSEGAFLYNTDGKQQAKLLIGKGGGVDDVSYGPEGDSVSGVSATDGTQNWTSEDGAKGKANPKIKGGKAIAFRKDAPGLVAVGHEGGITLWYPSDGSTRLIKAESEIVSLAFSPDGKHLAAFGADRHVRCFDVDKLSEEWAHGDVANDTKVVWAVNGKVVISGGDGDTVKAFNAADGSDAWEWKAPSANTHIVAVSPNGKLMASAGESEILVLTAK